MSRSLLKGWGVLALFLGTITYALAEDLTLTTYYPSPRGVYDELLVNVLTLGTPGNLKVPGSLAVGAYDPGAAGEVYISGKVGIGTATPASPLHVVGGDITVDLEKGLFDPTKQQGVWLRSGSGGGEALSLVAGGVSRLSITQAGNVGIGTASPQAALHIPNGGLRLGFVTRSQWPPTMTTYKSTTYTGGTLTSGTNNLGIHVACCLQSFVETGSFPANSSCYLRQQFTTPTFTPDWLIDIANAQCIVLCFDWPSQ